MAKVGLLEPTLPTWIMKDGITLAMEEPKLTAPLVTEVGKAGAMALVENKRNGFVIVRAGVEGMWEVIAPAIKESFFSTGKKIAGFGKSIGRKLTGRREAGVIEPAVIEPDVVVAPSESNVALSDYLKNSMQAASDTISSLKTDLEAASGTLLHQYTLASARTATSTPRGIELFGHTAQTFAKGVVANPAQSKELAREFGRTFAREFLRDPHVASQVLLNMAKGAVPVVYRDFVAMMGKFVKDLARLVVAIPTAAMKQALALAKKIWKGMKSLVGVESTALHKRSTGDDVVDIALLEAEAATDPFYADLLDSIREMERLGNLIYFKTATAAALLPR